MPWIKYVRHQEGYEPITNFYLCPSDTVERIVKDWTYRYTERSQTAEVVDKPSREWLLTELQYINEGVEQKQKELREEEAYQKLLMDLLGESRNALD